MLSFYYTTRKNSGLSGRLSSQINKDSVFFYLWCIWMGVVTFRIFWKLRHWNLRPLPKKFKNKKSFSWNKILSLFMRNIARSRKLYRIYLEFDVNILFIYLFYFGKIFRIYASLILFLTLSRDVKNKTNNS